MEGSLLNLIPTSLPATGQASCLEGLLSKMVRRPVWYNTFFIEGSMFGNLWTYLVS